MPEQLFLCNEAEIAAREKEYPHKSTCPCDRCGAEEVRFYISDGDYADCHIKCFNCGLSYWVDGPDA